MTELKEYNIPFVGLKTGSHRFEYEIKGEFFKEFEYDEFNSTALNVVLDFDKRPGLFELKFDFDGKVNVNCDVSNEAFDMELEGSLKLIVKFGEEFNDEDPEILIIPHGEYEINVAQYIYEMIVLSQPSKRIHPGIEDGTLNSEIMKKLKELQPKDNFEEEKEVDPRWGQLKDLLTGK
ncbi:MAG: DUF177 domain-containing protein [Bacteroidota bacterium]